MGVKKTSSGKIDKIIDIINNEELSANAMVAEIGELVDEEDSDPTMRKIFKILTDEDLSAEAMISEIGQLI